MPPTVPPRVDSPLPIAIVLRALDPGGTESQMLELARRLDPTRWTVHVACFRTDGAWAGRAAAGAQSIVEFPVRSFRSPRTARELHRFAQWCRSAHIAVVHTATLSGNLFGLAGAALARVPVRIGSQRGYDFDRSRTETLLQRGAYTLAHRVVANCQAVADALAARGLRRDRVAVVPNGVELGRAPRRTPRPVRRILMVGTLRTVKGHDVLIDSAPAVLAKYPDLRVEVVGGGPLLESLRARAAARGVASAFTFTGHRDDVADRLAAADAVVMPSRSEGLPNAVLEAMAAGTPIVASAVGGIPELIADAVNGLLVPPGDAPALSVALLRLAGDPVLAARLGAAARVTAETRFSFERMVAAHDRLYREELARAGHSTAVAGFEHAAG